MGQALYFQAITFDPNFLRKVHPLTSVVLTSFVDLMGQMDERTDSSSNYYKDHCYCTAFASFGKKNS